MVLKLLMFKRGVTTWSPFATAFNARSSLKFDLSFGRKETGLFEIPELNNANGFKELEDKAIAKADQLVEEATNNNGKRSRKMAQIFDELSDTLCQVADMAEFVRIGHPDQKFSQAAENACIAMSNIVEKLNTNRKLYDALSNVTKYGDIIKTSEIDDHVSNLFLFDFEQCGIHLPEQERRKVVELNEHILYYGQRFTAGATEPRRINIDLLPQDLAGKFGRDGKHVVVSGINTESPDTRVREAAYKIFLYPNEKQEKLLHEMLNSRHYLAQICGFPTYAHRAVRGSTMQTTEAVYDFLNLMNAELQERAQNDLVELQKIKNKDLQVPQPIGPWDTAYLSGLARKSWLGTSNEELAPYFSLGACMEGLNLLTQALFGVRLEYKQCASGEVWAPDVHKLAVIDENEGLLGHIYCDFFDRKNKSGQDCHFTIRGGRELPDGTYQLPIVVVMLTLPSPRLSMPSLLNPSLAENLFHEMGHALHSMLGRTKYQHVTGTRCSTDFAEVPSILMEYFCSDPRIVSMYAKHYETGESMPEDMLHKICAAKNLFPSSEMQSQVFYSMLDQVYHSGEIKDTTTTEIIEKIQNQYYCLPYVPKTAWQLRFSHLVGYGAKYYSYLSSRAIASWIWQTHFERDPLSRSAGEKYRRECLAHGGGKPPSKLVADYLNQEASPINFTKSVISDIDKRADKINSIKNRIYR
ncbi:hypothetical protein TKK_0001774 [Trichogramma kaykai]|uniref:Peptidase M3A/M3B catalytic domain-containing protein n=1 Tax=Trichogramma kaykai TaxID=54128 RepID=A0ABD2XGB4_9HYME